MKVAAAVSSTKQRQSLQGVFFFFMMQKALAKGAQCHSRAAGPLSFTSIIMITVRSPPSLKCLGGSKQVHSHLNQRKDLICKHTNSSQKLLCQ